MSRTKEKLRNFVRKKTLDLLGFRAVPSKGIHLLNSHVLTTEEDLNSNFFDYQLKTLSKKSTIIPFAEAVDLIQKKNFVNHSLIAFSYDDGFAECYSHIAPVLEKYNGFAGFFINPNFIDGDENYISNFLQKKVHLPAYKRPLKWTEIAELSKRGHIIGAHTMDHERITDLASEAEVHYQIGKCKEIISSRINKECNYFAFTYGHLERDFDRHSVQIAREYYKYIFSASNWRNYFSYDGQVFNRRHCEPFWNPSHINFFLSKSVR